MKTRHGFVSNSSSSSFLALTCRDEKVISTVLEKEDIDSDDLYEQDIWGVHNLQSGVELYVTEDGEVSFVGINIESSLNNGESLPDIKEKFVQILTEKYGIIVDVQKIHLSYGEWQT